MTTWLSVHRGSSSAFNDWLWQKDAEAGTVARMVRGPRMRDVVSLLDEWSAALQFPYYFGGNWAAFDECLADLEWLRAERYVIGILEADKSTLPEADWDALLQLLAKIAAEWSAPTSWRPARPFAVVAHVGQAGTNFEARCTRAGLSFSDVPGA